MGSLSGWGWWEARKSFSSKGLSRGWPHARFLDLLQWISTNPISFLASWESRQQLCGVLMRQLSEFGAHLALRTHSALIFLSFFIFTISGFFLSISLKLL